MSSSSQLQLVVTGDTLAQKVGEMLCPAELYRGFMCIEEYHWKWFLQWVISPTETYHYVSVLVVKVGNVITKYIYAFETTGLNFTSNVYLLTTFPNVFLNMAGKYKVVSWIEDQKFHMSTQILEKLWSCYFENLEDHILWTVNTSAILFARDISIHVMVNMWPERAPEAFSKATCNSHFT